MKEIEWLKRPIFWLVLWLGLIWFAIFQLPDNRLHLVFCDVGQGDAILITYRSNQILIDGGPNNRVLNCLANNLPFWDRTIEMVVLTHPQADHLTGLIDVIERYSVKQFIVNSIINDSAGFWAFYQAVINEGVKIYSPQAGDKIRLGPVQLLVLWPRERLGESRIWQAEERAILTGGQLMADRRQGEILGAASYPGDLNETSIVLRLSFGDFDALLTGDIGAKIETQLQTEPVEVLKVAHHGSRFSTSQAFLERVKPQLAVISVGRNRFGQPARETLERLRTAGIKVLRTDQAGEIEIVSDGKGWQRLGGG